MHFKHSLPIAAALLMPGFAKAAIDQLPLEERPAWITYLEVSQAKAKADEAALRAELTQHHLPHALRAPDGGDFKLSAKPGDAWFAGDEAKALAGIVLSYQTPAGGWSKHTGYSKGPRKPGMQWSSQNEPGKSPHYLGTFDNRSTTEQLNFLAGMWLATQREDCKAGFIKGLDYILTAQYPNGGWPQVYPLEGGYHDCVTLNDDALTHILELLRKIAGNGPFSSIPDEATRAKVARAFNKGIDCVIRMQVAQEGRKTAWCAQYDPYTLQPSEARKMEPASLSGMESAGLLRFLMTLAHPTPELTSTIESGLAWLERVKITGLARTKVEGKTVYVPDAGATEVYWARFYSLTDSRPLFPGRDGVIYHSFSEMAANNKLGYDFLSTRPGAVLNNDQKKWRKMLASGK